MGKKSSSSSATTTQMQDQRLVVGDGGFGVAAGGQGFLDESMAYTDSSSSTINVQNADAARIVELNSALLRDMGINQTDATKFIADMGADTIARLGESFTNVASVSASNSSRASEHMLDATEGVIDKLLAASARSSDGAQSLAQAAMSSYQPADSKMGDAFKWGAIAAAALVAMQLFKGK